MGVCRQRCADTRARVPCTSSARSRHLAQGFADGQPARARSATSSRTRKPGSFRLIANWPPRSASLTAVALDDVLEEGENEPSTALRDALSRILNDDEDDAARAPVDDAGSAGGDAGARGARKKRAAAACKRAAQAKRAKPSPRASSAADNSIEPSVGSGNPAAKRRELPGVRPGSKSPQATRRRLQRQLAAVALKLRNWMKDLHYEWIKKMFAECDILLWPWLQTKKMLSRGGVLAPYTKNLARALSHYLLMQRLYDKAQITQGKALLWISEPGTSKTCGVCGAIKESWAALGSSTATQSAAAAATACRATGKVQPTTSWLECCKCTLRGATVRCCCCAPVTHALLPALTTAQSSQTACWATSGRHLRTSEVGNAVPP